MKTFKEKPVNILSANNGLSFSSKSKQELKESIKKIHDQF